jgi:hypothetical protein
MTLWIVIVVAVVAASCIELLAKLPASGRRVSPGGTALAPERVTAERGATQRKRDP